MLIKKMENTKTVKEWNPTFQISNLNKCLYRFAVILLKIKI